MWLAAMCRARPAADSCSQITIYSSIATTSKFEVNVRLTFCIPHCLKVASVLCDESVSLESFPCGSKRKELNKILSWKGYDNYNYLNLYTDKYSVFYFQILQIILAY